MTMTSTVDAPEARRFLRLLFGDVTEDLYALVWTLPSKDSHWYPVTKLDTVTPPPDQDTYVGAGLARKAHGKRRRCPADQIAAITAVWADVDYRDEVHKKENLPPNEQAARDLIDSMGLAPSVVVHSGHGLQAWWLLAEPWVFKDADDRHAAALLTEGWQVTLRARAALSGWTVDATQDLARVMRLPGTLNLKGGAGLPVAIVHEVEGLRYSPSDFEHYMVEENEWRRHAAARAGYVTGQLTLDPDASPPFDKLDAALGNDAKFRQTWERTRRDLKDTSPSAYDQALATRAAQVGWSDQEIADLLIASRRKHGDDLKLRQDYYARTIATARTDQARTVGLDDLDEQSDDLDNAPTAAAAHHARRAITENLSALLGVRITRIVKYLHERPVYRIETPSGGVTIGEAGRAMEWKHVYQAVWDMTGITIPRFKAEEWRKVLQAIWKACELVETGEEATDAGFASARIGEYLHSRTVTLDRTEAVESSLPYIEDGHVYVFGPAFRAWLGQTHDRISPQRMGEILRRFGAEHHTISVVVNDRPTSRFVWDLGPVEDFGLSPQGHEQ